VLQANYVIDRGLRGEAAIRAFLDEVAKLREEVTSSWRTSCDRLAVTFENETEEEKDLAQPFHRVGEDLRRLLHSLADAPEAARPGEFQRALSELAATEGGKEPVQDNDPKSWPPTLQLYEAHKSIKELITGPHERIPESFFRNSISLQLGIKPEEVTWKQIKLAVTELFSRYPAITVVPDDPSTQPFGSPATMATAEHRKAGGTGRKHRPKTDYENAAHVAPSGSGPTRTDGGPAVAVTNGGVADPNPHFPARAHHG
jgi:hypothetical protein